MTNYIVSPGCVIAFACLAGLCTANSRAESLQPSEGNFITVQAAKIDENRNSLTLLVGSGSRPIPTAENTLSIVNLDNSDRRIIRSIELDQSFDILPPLSFYSDIDEGEYIVAHNSRSGTVLRWFDASGRQRDKQVSPFPEHAVIGIAKPGKRIQTTTNSGIYELHEDRRWQQIFAVANDDFIVSSSTIDDGECGHAVVVVQADYTSWNVQILCNRQGKLVAKYNMPGPSNIVPDIQIKVLRVSLQAETVWVAGPGEESGVAFAECKFANQPACIAVPLRVEIAGYPLVATHTPIAMVSDGLVAVASGEKDSVNLTLHKLDGRRVHEQELNLASARITDEYISRVTGVDVLGSKDRIWLVAQIASVYSGDRGELDRMKFFIDVGFDSFYYDEESEALVPVRTAE